MEGNEKGSLGEITNVQGVMEMFTIRIVVMVSWMYAYVKTYFVYFKYVQFFVCQLYCNEAALKKK